jgi:hypothetical protein
MRVERVLGERPFAEVGNPGLAVVDERRGLLAVAGTHEFGCAPVGVYRTGDLTCVALHRSHHPVHAMAFHPELPLLAVGTGRYDGGYFFEGELLLLDLETGATSSLIEHQLGRLVIGLEWLSGRELRLLMAPHDDWQDPSAWEEGHEAVLRPYPPDRGPGGEHDRSRTHRSRERRVHGLSRDRVAERERAGAGRVPVKVSAVTSRSGSARRSPGRP